MEYETQYDELEAKKGAPPGKNECLICSAGWARGVMIVMEECGMKLRGTYPGQEVPILQRSPSMQSFTNRGGR
jgi:hypothetical protein